MKNFLQKTLIVSIAASSAIYATNGDTLIGVGAKTRAMGGAGIALSQGAESTLVNPASITKVQSTEVSVGGTMFMPNIKTTDGAGNEFESDADFSVIPLVAIASNLNNGFYLGVGMYGTAGMGVDFRGTPSLMDMETTLQLMQFAVPIAYKTGNLSVGISPIMQYGSLDINYKNYMVNPPASIGYGQKQDFGFGVSVGAVYDFANGLSIGAVYKSKIEMDYKKVMSTATAPFGLNIGDKLTQPAEYGIGIAYRYGAHTIAFDYKKIKWSDADGYKGFGWDDQDVFAIGYQYDGGVWSLRAGYNHASSPITLSNTTPILNAFNILGFPATSQNHFTLGGSYQFNKNLSADATIVYSPEEKTTAVTPMGTLTNKHSELSLTMQINYKF